MPDYSLQFHLTDHQAATVDGLRGKMPENDFFRLCLQMGLVRYQDEALRQATEKLYAIANTLTENHEQAVRTLAVLPPGADDKPRHKPAPRIASVPEH